MSITRILANCTVSDLAAAERWYTTLFGRGPDANPMAGLLEWHLSGTFGLQGGDVVAHPAARRPRREQGGVHRPVRLTAASGGLVGWDVTPAGRRRR